MPCLGFTNITHILTLESMLEVKRLPWTVLSFGLQWSGYQNVLGNRIKPQGSSHFRMSMLETRAGLRFRHQWLQMSWTNRFHLHLAV